MELARRPRTSQKKKQRPLGSGTRLPRAEEEKLVVWVNRLRGEGVPISSVMLAKKAVKAATALSITGFVGSKAWQKRFRQRHHLSLRAKTRQGQIRPADAAEKAEAFGRKVREKIAEVKVDRVYNADQTVVMFEYIPKRTIEQTGSKTVWIRCASGTKTRATVMLLADSIGNKMKPTVILKTTPSKLAHVAAANVKDRHGFGIRTWSKVKQIQSSTAFR